MRIFFLILFTVLTFTSCESNNDEQPLQNIDSLVGT